jgi:hypothetical protein
MKTKFIIFFSLILFHAFAQEYDKNWLIGLHFPNSGTNLIFGKNETQTKSESFAIDVRHGGSTISNKAGEIQFYTNGTVIASAKNHKVMDNGWDLSLGSHGEDYEHSGYHIVPRKTFMIFPDNFDDDIYYLVYSYIIDDSVFFEISDFLQIAKIDMSKNEGKGEVVYKNRVLFNEKSVGKIELIKHANGLDWWLIARGIEGKKYTLKTCDP